ncbi:MAG TPA: cyclic-phosphate processing receiver domain-containing protein [Pyrinomonadaceae bacterium]|jgi:CheY-like chemotaxis protein|nr:cyclic-phosphate processing receiver domain-containing protein [Pyrinomonadaceae bacterium]
MSIWQGFLNRLGFVDTKSGRNPIYIFVLDDDSRRHRWFRKRFEHDSLDIAETVEEAKEFLKEGVYDAVFLDHDLLPEHYEGETDDEMTGYAIAAWLAENPKIQPAATIMVHTRNADAAVRMVEIMRKVGRSVEYVPFPMLEQRIKNYWRS